MQVRMEKPAWAAATNLHVQNTVARCKHLAGHSVLFQDTYQHKCIKGHIKLISHPMPTSIFCDETVCPDSGKQLNRS